MSVLTTKLKHLDILLRSLFSQLETCTHVQLNRRPQPGSWSAIQVMHHLMLSESYSRMYCEKKLKNTTQFTNSSVATHIRLLLLRWYLLSGLKAKAPQRVNTGSLPDSDSLDQVTRQWSEERQLLGTLLEKVSPDYFNKTIYKHPYAGHLTIPGMLDFFVAHFRHHVLQISKAAELKLVL